MSRSGIVAIFWLCLSISSNAQIPDSLIIAPPAEGCVRIATFNVSLNRNRAGELIENLKKGNIQTTRIASIIQLVAPDILLTNELDYDSKGEAARLFLESYLQVKQPISEKARSNPLKYFFTGPVNTGVPSGLDLNKNGRLSEPDDCWGFGAFPGQYAMAVYSRFPIEDSKIRTFQKQLWSTMPGALRPIDPSSQMPYWEDAVWKQLRLSSKSFWDVPIDIGGTTLHLVASHPTPPVFDGPEDRNGCRNHDEVRMVMDYVVGGEGSNYLIDDSGRQGPMSSDASFVIVGDLNSDPNDGDSRREAIRKLIESPRVAGKTIPTSLGGIESSKVQGLANKRHTGKPEQDTADFNDRAAGNIRCDYVLPSSDFEIVSSGVFWPKMDQLKDIDRNLVEASDHRLVWVDIKLKDRK